MFLLQWVSKDGQGFYDMGIFATHEAAEAGIEAARHELIAQCSDEEAEEKISEGSFKVFEIEE